MLAAAWTGWSATPANWDFLQLFAAVVAIIAARTVLKMQLTGATIFVAFVCGTLWAWLLEAWGVVPSISLALLLLVIAPTVRRRARGA